MSLSFDRRNFLKTVAGASAAMAIGSSQSIAKTGKSPARKGKSVVGLRFDPVKKVRVGVIGLGMRGPGAVNRLSKIEGCEIVALCDLRKDRVERQTKKLLKDGKPKPQEFYGDTYAWKKVCEMEEIDLIYTPTPWRWHTPICVYAMECGKHAATEVPAAISLEQCWQLVDTAERTQRHCMMLENCCYGFNELWVLNMINEGVFGEIVHGEGAYIHDLRSLIFSKKGYQGMWRLLQNAKNNGNLYPTHGLGPVCQYMNINRGDKMQYLTAVASQQAGMTAYAIDKYGADSVEAKQSYSRGDMNTTLIKTAQGRSMMIQHDVTSARPYSRLNTISGTKGIFADYPARLAVSPKSHGWMEVEDMEQYRKKYEHPLVKKIGEVAKKVGGHGGMDFMMDYRLIHCIRNGLPLDMNVYEAATWSSISPLSQMSIANQSTSVAVPDFTRGAWKTAAPLGIVS